MHDGTNTENLGTSVAIFKNHCFSKYTVNAQHLQAGRVAEMSTTKGYKGRKIHTQREQLCKAGGKCRPSASIAWEVDNGANLRASYRSQGAALLLGGP